MGCCRPKTGSPVRSGRREEIIHRFKAAAVHLMEEDEAVELGRGDLVIVKVFDGAVLLAVLVRINPDVQWPLTKDEPVVKIDALHYLFSLPEKNGGFLNYGVTFSGTGKKLAKLDSFLDENSCFSSASPRTPFSGVGSWSELNVGDYNGLVAKAIASGTGRIVNGFFKCSDIYANQVQKGAELIQPRSRNSGPTTKTAADQKRGSINRSIRSVRKLSATTEKMSQSLLDGVISATETLTAPVFRSRAGKSALTTAPGEALLATIDAVNRLMDAVEAAEKNTIAATGSAVGGAVSRSFGESAGEATEDVFAVAGHTVGTAWNIFKIRKAIGPSSSTASSILKSAARKKRSAR